jgi:preflagellin peptidase FlaK
VALLDLPVATLADWLRLLAVPVFGWAAYRDIRTRRVPNATWYPLAAVGLLALGLDVLDLFVVEPTPFRQELFLIQVVASLGLVAPMGYVFWRLGGFGGADAKGLIVIALLFPAAPTYLLATPSVALPLHGGGLVFSLGVLTNTVLIGLASPLALAARNAVAGRYRPSMFIGRPVRIEDLPTAYGRLLETPEGFTRRGLDVDALRMYLRWRGTTLAALRETPADHRDPVSIGATNEPGDGAVGPTQGAVADGGPGPRRAIRRVAFGEDDDPWGAARFLAEIESDAYGTTPEGLREGLEVLTEPGRERVWVTPGLPFIVPLFLGLVVALVYGDALFRLLTVTGLA